eukprot:6509920-Lingulodinium_polyedra.AAC.1
MPQANVWGFRSGLNSCVGDSASVTRCLTARVRARACGVADAFQDLFSYCRNAGLAANAQQVPR